MTKAKSKCYVEGQHADIKWIECGNRLRHWELFFEGHTLAISLNALKQDQGGVTALQKTWDNQRTTRPELNHKR